MDETLRAAIRGATLVKCSCQPRGEILGEYLPNEQRFWRKLGDVTARQCDVRCPKCKRIHHMDAEVYIRAVALLAAGCSPACLMVLVSETAV